MPINYGKLFNLFDNRPGRTQVHRFDPTAKPPICGNVTYFKGEKLEHIDAFHKRSPNLPQDRHILFESMDGSGFAKTFCLPVGHLERRKTFFEDLDNIIKLLHNSGIFPYLDRISEDGYLAYLWGRIWFFLKEKASFSKVKSQVDLLLSKLQLNLSVFDSQGSPPHCIGQRGIPYFYGGDEALYDPFSNLSDMPPIPAEQFLEGIQFSDLTILDICTTNSTWKKFEFPSTPDNKPTDFRAMDIAYGLACNNHHGIFKADGCFHIIVSDLRGCRKVLRLDEASIRKYSRWVTNLTRHLHCQMLPEQDAKTVCHLMLSEFENSGNIPTRKTFHRIAHHAGKIYLDLANDQGLAVEIDKTGWRVISNPPVHFIRTTEMNPLPYPEEAGDLKLLRKYLNAPNDHIWILLVSWLLSPITLFDLKMA